MSFMKLDLSAVDTSNTIPAGDYHVRCVEVKVENKQEGKEFILATFEVLNGDYNGRKIFERFTTQHSNPKAVQVGLGRLKRFLQAAQYKNPNELELMEMGGLECLATVKIEESPGYSPKNVISSFKKLVTITGTSSPF